MAREYTSEEILAMQKDAVRRVAQMRKLSRARVQEPEQQQKQPKSPDIHPAPTGTLDSFLDSIGTDSETLLILAVLFLLIKEKADSTLILALVYLLL